MIDSIAGMPYVFMCSTLKDLKEHVRSNNHSEIVYMNQSIYESLKSLVYYLSTAKENSLVLYFDLPKIFEDRSYGKFVNKFRYLHAEFLVKNNIIIFIVHPDVYEEKQFLFEKISETKEIYRVKLKR